MGIVILGRRAIAQCILSTITASTGIPAVVRCRKRISGKASAGGASTITIVQNTALGTDLEGFLDGCTVEIVGGTGAGQVRKVLGHVGSTLVLTVDVAWVTAPDNTSGYVIRHDMDDVPAQTALVTVETAAINACVNGSAPTATAGTNIGVQLGVAQSWLLDNPDSVDKFRAINAVNASGSIVKVITFA